MQSPGQKKAPRSYSLLLSVLSLLIVAGIAAVLIFGWKYYLSSPEQRMLSAEHGLFKASGTIGIACGVAATLLFLSNLFYLPRRRYTEALSMLGPLHRWLSWHVISGLGGGAIVFLHAVFQIKSTVGAALVWSLGIVVVTGAVGRYMLRLIPRNRAGELLPMASLEEDVMSLIDELRPFATNNTETRQVMERMADTVDSAKGAMRNPGLGGTLSRLRKVNRDLSTLRRSLDARGAGAGAHALGPLLGRVKTTYRQAAAYQFASVFMDSWRTFHRVLALFFLVALGFHIGVAIYYGFVGI